jgi:hypothetical protein
MFMRQPSLESQKFLYRQFTSILQKVLIILQIVRQRLGVGAGPAI